MSDVFFKFEPQFSRDFLFQTFRKKLFCSSFFHMKCLKIKFNLFSVGRLWVINETWSEQFSSWVGFFRSFILAQKILACEFLRGCCENWKFRNVETFSRAWKSHFTCFKDASQVCVKIHTKNLHLHSKFLTATRK